MSAYGAALRVLRKRRGLSLRDLGRLCSIDHGYIAKIETGSKAAPALDSKTLALLSRHVRATRREAAMLELLAQIDCDVALALAAMADDGCTVYALAIAAVVDYSPGTRPPAIEILARAARAAEIMFG